MLDILKNSCVKFDAFQKWNWSFIFPPKGKLLIMTQKYSNVYTTSKNCEPSNETRLLHTHQEYNLFSLFKEKNLPPYLFWFYPCELLIIIYLSFGSYITKLNAYCFFSFFSVRVLKPIIQLNICHPSFRGFTKIWKIMIHWSKIFFTWMKLTVIQC